MKTERAPQSAPSAISCVRSDAPLAHYTKWPRNSICENSRHRFRADSRTGLPVVRSCAQPTTAGRARSRVVLRSRTIAAGATGSSGRPHRRRYFHQFLARQFQDVDDAVDLVEVVMQVLDQICTASHGLYSALRSTTRLSESNQGVEHFRVWTIGFPYQAVWITPQTDPGPGSSTSMPARTKGASTRTSFSALGWVALRRMTVSIGL